MAKRVGCMSRAAGRDELSTNTRPGVPCYRRSLTGDLSYLMVVELEAHDLFETSKAPKLRESRLTCTKSCCDERPHISWAKLKLYRRQRDWLLLPEAVARLHAHHTKGYDRRCPQVSIDMGSLRVTFRRRREHPPKKKEKVPHL